MTGESPQRRAWRVTEPLHALVYLVPEAPQQYAKLGVNPAAGYFAARAAPMGPVGPGIVTATFYSFNPELVASAMTGVWDVTTPAAMVEARLAVADAALRRGLGDEVIASPEVAEAAGLARRAAEAAGAWPQGRPLFAAHAALAWPDEPHLVLWHAQMLLREYRGDGHIAVLLTNGLSGLQANVLHVASGEQPEAFLRGTRGWRRPAWAAAQDEMRGRGLLGEEGLTEAGHRLRATIEEATDRLAEPAYDTLGLDGCTRLAELTRPLSRTIVKAGLLNPAQLATGGKA